MTTKDIKYWLEEKDLKTPEHDKMVLWCFDNYQEILDNLSISNLQIKKYFNKRYSFGELPLWNWDDKKYNSNNKELNKKIELLYERFKDELKKMGNLFEIKKIIEYKLPSIYNHGFIDLAIFFKHKTITVYEDIYEDNYYFATDIERRFQKLYDYDDSDLRIFFEIKPKINSVGEIMRQINYYREYLPEGYFILVTKTKGLKETFESQNVFVYEYEEDEENGERERQNTL